MVFRFGLIQRLDNHSARILAILLVVALAAFGSLRAMADPTTSIDDRVVVTFSEVQV